MPVIMEIWFNILYIFKSGKYSDSLSVKLLYAQSKIIWICICLYHNHSMENFAFQSRSSQTCSSRLTEMFSITYDQTEWLIFSGMLNKHFSFLYSLVLWFSSLWTLLFVHRKLIWILFFIRIIYSFTKYIETDSLNQQVGRVISKRLSEWISGWFHWFSD